MWNSEPRECQKFHFLSPVLGQRQLIFPFEVVLTLKVTVHGIWLVTSFWKFLKERVTIIWWSTPSLLTQSVVLAWDHFLCQTCSRLCWCKTITNDVHSLNYIHKLVHLDNDFTGPTVKAVLTMLAGSHTRPPAQAPFHKFHPDAACAVILLKCKPQIQLCLLWLCRPSVNTQRCHNVAITAGQYFNNNLFGQLQLHH